MRKRIDPSTGISTISHQVSDTLSWLEQGANGELVWLDNRDSNQFPIFLKIFSPDQFTFDPQRTEYFDLPSSGGIRQVSLSQKKPVEIIIRQDDDQAAQATHWGLMIGTKL